MNDKENKSKDTSDPSEFDFIFNNDIDQKSIEKKLKQIKTRNQCIIFSVILAIIGFFAMQYYAGLANQDYIDGNILKISAGTSISEPQDIYHLANPWNNASFMGLMLFQPLFVTDSTFTEILNGLAEDYTVSSDGLTYTITLQEDLKWSDGEPLTVEDVVFSFESFLLCSGVNSNMDTAFQKIVGAEAWSAGESDSLEGISTEGNVITFQLSSRYNNFLMMLTQFAPLPKHILEDWSPETLTSSHEFFQNENPVCSGRFMSAGLDEDKNIVLVLNPNYCYSDSQTEIEKIIAYWDWKNMDIDYYSTTDITQMVSYRSMKNYTEYDVDVFFYRYFVFNVDGSEAVDDVKVRQAVWHAIDTEKLFGDIYLNSGSLVYNGNPNSTAETYPYDPEKALTLLREANFDFSETFVIAYYYSDATSFVFLEKVADYLSAVGIKVELMKATNAELYTEPSYDMLLKGLSAFNSEDWYNEYLSTNGNMSALMGDDGYFDDLVDNLNGAVTVEEYRQYMEELVAMEDEYVYKLPLFTLNQCVYINTNRISLPENMTFGNVRYSSAVHLNQWSIKKS